MLTCLAGMMLYGDVNNIIAGSVKDYAMCVMCLEIINDEVLDRRTLGNTTLFNSTFKIRWKKTDSLPDSSYTAHIHMNCMNKACLHLPLRPVRGRHKTSLGTIVYHKHSVSSEISPGL